MIKLKLTIKAVNPFDEKTIKKKIKDYLMTIRFRERLEEFELVFE